MFLWNYRGYGRSTGSPSLETMKTDGEYIVNYVKTVLHPNKVGVHGESLGGCIATHLARVCSLDFLFADRTFSSLSSTVLFAFGKLAHLCFKLSGITDSDSVYDYIKADCYKTVSADPKDEIIDDSVSLKSGIALSLGSTMTMKDLYENRVEDSGVFTIAEMNDFINTVKELRFSYKEHMKSQPKHGLLTVYLEIGMILRQVHVAQKSLTQLAESCKPLSSLYLWLLVFCTWPDPEESFKVLDSSLCRLNAIQAEHSSVVVSPLLRALQVHLERLLSKCPVEMSAENRGHLLPLLCGHNGSLSGSELTIYYKHLTRSRFLN